MIRIDMPMPEKCEDCIFRNEYCNCAASDYDGLGINVGCAFTTGRRDIRCPLKEIVRCKDCKKFIPPHGCTHVGNYIDGDWFCADGVRKDG